MLWVLRRTVSFYDSSEHPNICYGSSEHPQHTCMFWLRNKKINFNYHYYVLHVPYLQTCELNIYMYMKNQPSPLGGIFYREQNPLSVTQGPIDDDFSSLFL